MSHYLGLALFAEGSTDHCFLRPLLRRLCEETCLQHGVGKIEISEIQELRSPSRFRQESRETRIYQAAREAAGSWSLLFIHADGEGQPDKARKERVLPASRRLEREGHDRVKTVAVVPVRETEAWALTDKDALRQLFGARTVLTDVPDQVASVEQIEDPKQRLNQVLIASRTRGQHRRRLPMHAYLEPLGERIALDQLRQVPAFQRMEADLLIALEELRYISRDP